MLNQYQKDRIRESCALLHRGDDRFSQFEYYEMILKQHKDGTLDEGQKQVLGLNTILTPKALTGQVLIGKDEVSLEKFEV